MEARLSEDDAPPSEKLKHGILFEEVIWNQQEDNYGTHNKIREIATLYFLENRENVRGKNGNNF
ncbi:MAG: hypothetical protein IJ635_04845 [Bacteroidaceae bacterium]|nr:hypothetical protein [Bacteroidaceae bacterium]